MDRQVTLVCGPPCAGKTTYVAQHAKAGDAIVDYDVEAVKAGSERSHHHEWRYAQAAAEACRSAIAKIADDQGPITAWVIRSDDREADLLDATVVWLIPDRDELHHRAWQRPDPQRTIRDIDRWLLNHG